MAASDSPVAASPPRKPAPAAAPPPNPRLHAVWLRAAVTALATAAILMAAVHSFMQMEVDSYPQRFNIHPLPAKLLGLALQRRAFVDPSLVPVYGSSELVQPEQNRADQFFRSQHTGVGAFFIGNPGETCLMIATKLAAAAPADVRNRKAVIFLSPGWFVAPQLDHPGFGVNFSPLHGGVFTFESQLSPPLKQDLARRLLEYPDILAKYPLLKAGLTCLAANTPGQRVLLKTLTPLALVHNGVQRELDYARLGLWWWHDGLSYAPEVATESRRPGRVDWGARMREARDFYVKQPPQTVYCAGPRTAFDDWYLTYYKDPQHPERTPDQNFAQRCAVSKEWTDYRLLLRTIEELKIDALVICQPVNVNFCRLQGISEQACAGFYEKLRQETGPFPVRLQTYPKEGQDARSFHDATHPSALMWLIYDRLIYDFCYGRAPRKE